MTTRYQKSQIEDLARILHKYYLGIAYGPGYSAGIAGDFVDLFAADSPSICSVCGTSPLGGQNLYCVVGFGAPSREPTKEHNWEGGFNPKQFLAACGLESEG